MRNFFAAFLAISIILVRPSHADDSADRGAAFAPIDAQELVNHCWDISFELRSGSTLSTRFGFIETLTCLRRTIVEQSTAIVKPGSWSPAYAEWLLIEMAGPYAEFFDKLYNAHKHCFCGTMNYNVDLWAVSQLYETVLRDVIDLRNKHGI
jgi:hypothetical protein